MQQKRNLVRDGDYEQIPENIRRFNEGLAQDIGLKTLLASFRVWYYVPQEDSVGPSKFIGYEDMTAVEYMDKNYYLDGRDTELVLKQWFEELEEGTPEYRYVEQKVDQLTAQFGRRTNVRARFCAPRGWRVSSPRVNSSSAQTAPTPSQTRAAGINGHDESDAIVEVFVRAFGTLRPSEQADVLSRISA
jgi:hypothetical protein